MQTHTETVRERENMSRNEAVTLGARLLALLLTIWALSDLLYVPTEAYSVLHHSYQGSVLSISQVSEYWHHYYAMVLGFTFVRVIGFGLTARWLYRGGQEVVEFLLPTESTMDSLAENS